MNTRKHLETTITFPKSVFTGNRTYSSLFLPPAFNLNFDSDLAVYLVNTYIDDAELKHLYKRPLFVLLQTTSLDYKFKALEQELKENKNFVYSYFIGTYGNRLLIMYVFECPPELENDYDRFIYGKYSTFSLPFKNRFAKIVQDVNGNYVESPLYGVVFKTPTLKRKIEKLIFVNSDEKLDKEQEYFGQPDRKIEVFRHETSK